MVCSGIFIFPLTQMEFIGVRMGCTSSEDMALYHQLTGKGRDWVREDGSLYDDSLSIQSDNAPVLRIMKSRGNWI
jgi:hypothetical protein